MVNVSRNLNAPLIFAPFTQRRDSAISLTDDDTTQKQGSPAIPSRIVETSTVVLATPTSQSTKASSDNSVSIDKPQAHQSSKKNNADASSVNIKILSPPLVSQLPKASPVVPRPDIQMRSFEA